LGSFKPREGIEGYPHPEPSLGTCIGSSGTLSLGSCVISKYDIFDVTVKQGTETPSKFLVVSQSSSKVILLLSTSIYYKLKKKWYVLRLLQLLFLFLN
jgi:hypothetical protein